MDYNYLYLTCGNIGEAKIITKTLLEKHLIACAKFIDVNSSYWWDDEIVDDNEVLVIMESVSSLFDEIESVVAELHSFDTFVLESVPVNKVSKGAKQWLTKELKSSNL